VRKIHWDISVNQELPETRGHTYLQLTQCYMKGYVKDSCPFFEGFLQTDIDLCFFINWIHSNLAM